MELDMDGIVDNLYVGGRQATKNPDILREIGVTHVLTISDEKVSKIADSGFFKYKYIEGLDIEITDLLMYFPEVTEFIQDGVKSGAVLVHCNAGVSRSVTMVIAFLMEKKGMSFQKALKLVQKKRKYAYPNEGFQKQLKLYEDMKCRLDPSNEEYKLYRLSSLALTMQGDITHVKDFRKAFDVLNNTASDSCRSFRFTDRKIVLSSFGLLDSQSLFIPGDLQKNPVVNTQDIVFKCKKCRQPLFNKSGFLKHEIGPGTVAFDWRATDYSSTREDNKPREICDQSIFIEPVEWMKESILSTEGKLVCPKCSSKIGSYVWHGERCPCGEWVVPAFHIQTSKVDECKPMENVPKTHLKVDSKDKHVDSDTSHVDLGDKHADSDDKPDDSQNKQSNCDQVLSDQKTTMDVDSDTCTKHADS